MDPALGAFVDSDTPKLNPIIAEGIAVAHLKEAAKRIDDVFRILAKGFPPGLVYLGCQRCNPNEEINEVTKPKGPKGVYDVAPTMVFMMKYFLEYNGEKLPTKYLYLPFVSDAGCILLGGSRFNISPIHSDRVISVGTSNIFVRILKDRMTFERTPYHYMIDGKRETVHVAWAMLHHKNAKQKAIKRTVRGECTLAHYLFCKYGLMETFSQFANCKPVVGGEEINPTVYPEDEWAICSSTELPRTVAKTFYEPPKIKLAIRRSEMTPMVKNLVAAFFYVVDRFPARILPEYIGISTEKRLWMTLLGILLFSGSIHEGKLYSDIQDHLTSLDEYLDDITVTKLKEIDVNVDNLYQLLALIIENFTTWLLEAQDNINSMYDKELSVNYYVLYQITSSLCKMQFQLKAAAKKATTNGKILTSKEITNILNNHLRPGLVYKMTRGHGEVSNISYPGDNKALKITSILIPQKDSNRINSKKGRQVIDDPAQKLHESIAEIGGYTNMPKAEPSGRSRLNPYVQIDERGMLLRNPKFTELLLRTRNNFKGIV